MINLNKVSFTYNKGTEYLNKHNYKKAVQLLKQVINEYPCKEAYTNIGNAYRGLGLDKEMFSSYKLALLDDVPFLDPNSNTHLHAMNNLGLAYYMQGDDDNAIRIYTKAIKLNPEFWEAWWNCSTATLRKASSGMIDLFPRGWEMYKARFLKSDPIKMKNDREDLVYWDKKSSGSSILVLTEQGIGDNIMWGRYLSHLPFDEVVVQCDASLEPIFSDYKCVRHASECTSPVAYPICSLSECFDFIPPGDWLRDKFEPYSFPSSSSSKPNVGIVWSGSPTHSNDRYRSTNIERFRQLSRFANLYSLTPGFTGNAYVKPLDIASWADTGSYIAGLDLVIGVDTSVMHLVGSMGACGWLMQPMKETDFRWGNGVNRSVWYNSINIFSNPGSWESVFKEVSHELEKCTG